MKTRTKQAVSADPELDKLATVTAEALAVQPLPEHRARSRDEVRVDQILRQIVNEPVEAEPCAPNG